MNMECRLDNNEPYCAPGMHFIDLGEEPGQLAGTDLACAEHAPAESEEGQ